MSLVSPSLLAAVQAQYRLDWHGIHGLGHWRRVHAIGAKIAAAAGADARVVELFAYLHDACRHNDHRDPDHGPRAVDLARALRGRHFELEDAAFDTLCQALAGHTHGGLHAHVDIACCWDADRLDLGRVRIRTHPSLLSLEVSRERGLFEWAVGLWRDGGFLKRNGSEFALKGWMGRGRMPATAC